MNVFFITGIDTDSGKTIATGHIAAYLQRIGKRVITQKIVQTGCEGIAEDLVTHRNIMGCGLLPEDKNRSTCPQVFPYPASPHLSAALANEQINIPAIQSATKKLAQDFDYVLLEGAGGLHVPLNEKMHIIDYIKQQQLPVILVSSSRLGSINHTLLSLEVLAKRNIVLKGLVYNHYPQESELIFQDTRLVLQRALRQFYKPAAFWELPVIKKERQTAVSFEGLEE